MTFAKPDWFSLRKADALMQSARGYFSTETEVATPVVETPAPAQSTRETRLSETERDRQLLSEVEREDSEMLARVRDALYADD